MKVYVVFAKVAYEESRLLHICATEASATKEVEAYEIARVKGELGFIADYFEIEEWEVET